jgi:hypothetical protein
MLARATFVLAGGRGAVRQRLERKQPTPQLNAEIEQGIQDFLRLRATTLGVHVREVVEEAFVLYMALGKARALGYDNHVMLGDRLIELDHDDVDEMLGFLDARLTNWRETLRLVRQLAETSEMDDPSKLERLRIEANRLARIWGLLVLLLVVLSLTPLCPLLFFGHCPWMLDLDLDPFDVD